MLKRHERFDERATRSGVDCGPCRYRAFGDVCERQVGEQMIVGVDIDRVPSCHTPISVSTVTEDNALRFSGAARCI